MERGRASFNNGLRTLRSNTELRAFRTRPSLICTGASEVLDVRVHGRVVTLSERRDLANAIFQTGEEGTATDSDAVRQAGRVIERKRSIRVVARLRFSEQERIQEG